MNIITSPRHEVKHAPHCCHLQLTAGVSGRAHGGQTTHHTLQGTAAAFLPTVQGPSKPPRCWVQVAGLVPPPLSVHSWLSQLVIQGVFGVCGDSIVFRQPLIG